MEINFDLSVEEKIKWFQSNDYIVEETDYDLYKEARKPQPLVGGVVHWMRLVD